jgi:hypothetical protein
MNGRLLCILYCSFLCSCLICNNAKAGFGQGSAGTEGGNEPRYLVEMPTAGMLAKSTLGLDIDFFQEGGVLVGLNIGLFNRFSLGVSYGGSGLIGSDEAVMNPAPGVNAKLRIIEENSVLPALALGFDSQGREGYMNDLDRYRIKSPGFYVAGSKNYSLLGFFSIHGGVNYSLEGDEKKPNFFIGIEKTVGSVISLVAEYNSALNDAGDDAVAKGRGYLNLGFRWAVGGGLTLGVDLKDLLDNAGTVTIGNRGVRLEYITSF